MSGVLIWHSVSAIFMSWGLWVLSHLWTSLWENLSRNHCSFVMFSLTDLVSHHGILLLAITALDLFLGPPLTNPSYSNEDSGWFFSSSLWFLGPSHWCGSFDWNPRFCSDEQCCVVTSSVVGVGRNALDGCSGFLSGHSTGLTHQALVVAGPQPASLSIELPPSDGVNSQPSSVVSPGGSEGGSLLHLPPLCSPSPCISLSTIDDDYPKVTSLSTLATGPDLTHVFLC
jgi:hypothetical protein